MDNLQIECSWEVDGDLLSCVNSDGGSIVLTKPINGPKRCELKLLFTESVTVHSIELLSSARIVEVYGTSSSGQEEYWQSNRAKDPVSPGLWQCVVPCGSQSRSPVSMKLFSLSPPANACLVKGLKISCEAATRQPAQKTHPHPQQSQQGPGLEEMISLATRMMPQMMPQATDMKKYCDMKFLVLESKISSMESLLPQVDWLVKEMKGLKQEVCELKKENREQSEQIKQLMSAKRSSPQCPSLKYAAARDERKRDRRRSCPIDLNDAESKLEQLRRHKSLTRSSSTPSATSLERARKFFGFPNNSSLQEWMRATKTSSPSITTDSPPDCSIRPFRRSSSVVRPFSVSQ